MYRIYCLKDPITNEIRYVGATHLSLDKRLKYHIDETKGTRKHHKCNWIRGLVCNNLIPKIELIEECEDSIWQEREKYWIAYGKEHKWNLTNKTLGGDGVSGYVFTDEVKKKISDKLIGKPISPEAIEKIRQKAIGRKLSEEGKEKLRLANIGKPKSEETKRKISVKLKGRKVGGGKVVWTYEMRSDMSKKQKKRFQNPEERAKLSEIGRKGAVARWNKYKKQ